MVFRRSVRIFLLVYIGINKNYKYGIRRCEIRVVNWSILREHLVGRILKIEDRRPKKLPTDGSKELVRQGFLQGDAPKPLVGAHLRPSGLQQRLGHLFRRAYHRIMPGLDFEILPAGVSLDALFGAGEIGIERLHTIDVGARQEVDAAPLHEVGQAHG